MIILAIDSGIEKTGYAFFEKDRKHHDGFKYITSGLIKTSKTKTTEQRLEQIYNELARLFVSYNPSTLIIEQLFFFKNQKTIIRVSQAQGAVMLLAAQKKIPVDFLTPLQIKQIVTGYGQSDKKSVQKMLAMTLKFTPSTSSGQVEELKQDDRADAIACGLAYCYINK